MDIWQFTSGLLYAQGMGMMWYGLREYEDHNASKGQILILALLWPVVALIATSTAMLDWWKES
jgi:hypothetical protein